jgi:hypothetical protein
MSKHVAYRTDLLDKDVAVALGVLGTGLSPQRCFRPDHAGLEGPAGTVP